MTQQGCFFDVSYINFAWGFQHSGIVIDQDGSVLHWDLSKQHTPKAGLTEKIAHAVLVGRLPQAEMRALCELLASVEPAPLEVVGEMRDGGGIKYVGYTRRGRGWETVVLANHGAELKRHPSVAAQQLVEWLAQLRTAVLRATEDAKQSLGHSTVRGRVRAETRTRRLCSKHTLYYTNREMYCLTAGYKGTKPRSKGRVRHCAFPWAAEAGSAR